MTAYFVSYSWVSNDGAKMGHGAASVEWDVPISDYEQVREIVKRIAKGHPPGTQVVVLNWREYEGPGGKLAERNREYDDMARRVVRLRAAITGAMAVLRVGKLDTSFFERVLRETE